MPSILEEFVVKLGFEVDEKKLDKFRDGIKDLGKIFLEFTGLASLAGISISGLYHHMQSSAVEIGETSHLLGIGSNKLQQWTQAADEAGASGKSLADAMARANKSIGSIGTAYLDQGFIEKNVALGIPINGLKTGEEYLLRVADILKSTSNPQRKSFIASQLGFSDKDILFLEQGSKKIKELVSAQNATFSPDFIRRSEETQKLLRQTTSELEYMAATIFNDLAPAIKDVINNFKDWVSENREAINSGLKDFIIDLAKVVKFLASHIKEAAIALGLIYGSSALAGIASLIGLFRTFNAVVMANPLVALATGIGSLAYFGSKQISDSYGSDDAKAKNALNFMSSGGFANFGVANSLTEKAFASRKSASSNSQTNHVNVTVNTSASDPHAVADIVDKKVKTSLDNLAKDIYTNNKSQVVA